MAPLLTYSTADRLRDRAAALKNGDSTPPRDVLIQELEEAATEIDRLEKRVDILTVDLAQLEKGA